MQFHILQFRTKIESSKLNSVYDDVSGFYCTTNNVANIQWNKWEGFPTGQQAYFHVLCKFDFL